MIGNKIGQLAKRIFDLVIAIFVLLLIWPMLLVVAFGIKIGSHGPVFYRGIRTGKHNKEFRIFKFRTMVEDAEELGGPSTGMGDMRVTSIGRLLRKYKIDELPNLINVVIGEMSLVGPRPEVPRYTSLYTDEEKIILSVRPGITDLSSIKFSDLASHIGSEDVDENFEQLVLPEKNRLRVEYVKSQSFFGDLNILYKTVCKLLPFEKSGNGVR